MVVKRGPGRKPRVTYKCHVAMFPHEWDELAMEAQSRGISGGELIGAILSQWIHDTPPQEAAPPPAEVSGDEGVELR